LTKQIKQIQLPRIKGFIETSFVDWDGRVSAVVFLPGCNFDCPFCHNTELCKQPETLETVPLLLILEKLSDLKNWVDGVVITGGEPTLHPALPELIRAIKKSNIDVKIDTNGSRPSVISSLIEEHLIDGIAMDIKAPLVADAYNRLTGVDTDMTRISRSIKIISRSSIWKQFRTTVIPEWHNWKDIETIVNSIRMTGASFKLQGYRPPETPPPVLENTPAFDPDTLKEWQQKANQLV